MEIWNRHFECMDRSELRKVQSERLLETVERIYFNVPYYRHKMQEAGLGPESIHTIDDLSRLPYTTKQDLRDNYPFGLFAVPMSEIKPHYLLIVDRVNNLDTLELKVEVDEAFFLDKISQLESLQMKIQENLESSLGLGIKVTLVEPKMIERSDGKSTRVIDRRKF